MEKMFIVIPEEGSKEPIEWRFENMPEYIYYCTNNSREGIFEINLRENTRTQTAGTCDFCLSQKNRFVKSYFTKNYKNYERIYVNYILDSESK